MQIRPKVRQFLMSTHLHKDAPPPPRWQTLIASFYLGMLLYLAAQVMNLI
jgi:hypothetical protein